MRQITVFSGHRVCWMNKKWIHICQNIPVSPPDAGFFGGRARDGAAKRNNRCFLPGGQRRGKQTADWDLVSPQWSPPGPSDRFSLWSAAPWRWNRPGPLETSAKTTQQREDAEQERPSHLPVSRSNSVWCLISCFTRLTHFSGEHSQPKPQWRFI